MKWFIRVLKVKAGGAARIRLVLQITNDVGDAIYDGQWPVLSIAVDDEQPFTVATQAIGPEVLQTAEFSLNKSSTDILKITVARREADTCSQTVQVQSNDLSIVAKSRDILVDEHHSLTIHENLDNSIYGRIWNGGLALVDGMRHDSADTNAGSADIHSIVQSSRSIIDIGTGTGLVGLSAMMVCPEANVTFTDTKESQPIFERNLAANVDMLPKVRTRYVAWDWNDPLPDELDQDYDLILLGDCIYNPSTHDALLSALAALMGGAHPAARNHPLTVCFAHKNRSAANREDQFITRFKAETRPAKHQQLQSANSVQIDIFQFSQPNSPNSPPNPRLSV